jgi:general secretion pathway protein K
MPPSVTTPDSQRLARRRFLAGRRGSVIVVILALVTLTAFLLTAFVERSMTEMLVESRARMSDRLRADAHSALEATLAVLADYKALDDGLRSPAQGWGEPLAGLELPRRPGTTVEIRFEDETGRLSLPRLAAPMLEELARQIGVKEADTKVFAEALLVWTKDTGTSSRFETDPRNYEYSDPPHRPPGRALESFNELAAIAGVRELLYTEGRPNALYERFVHAVSRHDFPETNLNTATADALQLAGLDQNQIARLQQLNSGSAATRPAGVRPWFRSLGEAQTLAGIVGRLPGFGTRVHCLRIAVTVREGPTAFHLDAVVSPDATAEAPEGARIGRESPSAAPTNAGAASAAGETRSLNYPFTLLSLEEKIELAPAPVS